jgi:peptide/nickel transport system ATP-binding protein
MTPPLLEVGDIRAYYKTLAGIVKAVDGVSLKVVKKEILGIAGESGCGKSTLVKAILRLLKPPGYIHSGKVLLNGIDLLGLDEESLRKLRWSKISYIPQSSMNSLNPVMRIEDQIIDTANDWPKDKAKEKASQLLRMASLPERCARMYPHELSGGMKQRAIICAAILLSPELIIADEPTTALDVIMQRGILQMLVELKESLQASIMVITHDMAVHAEIADRMAIMYAGKISELGSACDIFRDPLHPYTKALMQSIPNLEDKREMRGLPGRPPSLLGSLYGCRFHPRCPGVMEICKREEPPVRETNPGRLVACHLYG